MSKEYTPFKMKGFSGFGNSPLRQDASKEVTLRPRVAHPGDAVFGGSETSEVHQPYSSQAHKGEKTYTHFPEGMDSTEVQTSGKRTKTINPDKSFSVTKERTLGGTKTFEYGESGELISKVKRDKKGKITKAKGGIWGKKLRGKGRKTKDFSKKEKKVLREVKKTYHPGGPHQISLDDPYYTENPDRTKASRKTTYK